jgi:hypothetical protein
MSLIIGVLCDSCGASDIEDTADGRNIDNFPRNNWFSITQWEGQSKGKPEAELHVCSITCMGSLPKALSKQEHKEEHGYGHTH